MAGRLSVYVTAPNGKLWTQPTGLFINNESVSSSGQITTSVDPVTEEDIATVHAASEEDVDKAVKAARAAFRSPAWKDLPATGRGILMSSLAASEAFNTDLVEAIATTRCYNGWADKIHGQTISVLNKIAYTIRQPVSVVAQIIPWNYPLSMATWKLGPALACGNTVVLKAAEQTPYDGGT